MFILKLVLKNALRHKLRTILTVIGVSIAVMSFGFIRTIVTAWSAGVEASAENRLITRQAVSFVFPLPYSYLQQIQQIPGVTEVSYANWFNGVYKDAADWKNFFPRIAIDPETYLALYPEFVLPADQYAAFKKERNSCIVGEKLAEGQGFHLGDIIPIEGDIYPGRWEFVVRGIYRGRDPSTDETQMFFHWDYLNERMHVESPGREGLVGWYVIGVHNSSDMPRVAKAVDDLYRNSRAPTKTETEREFQQSFVSMSSAIINSLKAVSYVIITVILLVLANTIVMAARERTKEYAVLKTLGYSGGHIIGLIAGESMLIASTGCLWP
jgi:putative ABC transport system permease protein